MGCALPGVFVLCCVLSYGCAVSCLSAAASSLPYSMAADTIKSSFFAGGRVATFSPLITGCIICSSSFAVSSVPLLCIRSNSLLASILSILFTFLQNIYVSVHSAAPLFFLGTKILLIDYGKPSMSFTPAR